MTWVGIIVGFILGFMFHSMGASIVLAILGGIIGSLLARNSKATQGTAAPAGQLPGSPHDLQAQLEQLQREMHSLMQRMATVEKQLQGGAAPAGSMEELPAAEAETFIDPSTPESRQQQPESGPISHEVQTPVSPLPAMPPQPETRQAEPVAAVRTAEDDAARAAQEPSAEEQHAPSTQAPHPQTPLPPAEPSWLAQLLQRWIFGGNPLVKIGVLILFLGLAFLLRYVAEHTVVPVELRYAGVAAAGIGLLLFGWRWRTRQDNYGMILQGAGVGVMYLTTLTAMRLHPLIPPAFGFAILLAVALLAALLAILQDAVVLAIVGTLFGFAAPVLASTGSANHAVFFSYLALLNVGIVAIAWFKAWRELNLIGFVCSFVLAGAWGKKYWAPELLLTVEPFLLLFFVLYVLITFLFARRTLAQAPHLDGNDFEQHALHSASHVNYVDGMLVFGVPFASFGLQYLVLRHFEYGAAFAALGFGFAYVAMAFVLFRKTGVRYALLNETMIALAVIFGTLAIPLGLEQKWTAAAWAVEAAGTYWIGIRQHRIHARMFALLLLFGSAVYFALGLRIAAAGSVLDGSLLGAAMLATGIWWVYRLLRTAPDGHVQGFERELQSWLLACGAFFVALLPFLLWTMTWAATALAILGAAGVFVSRRIDERTLTIWSWLYQGMAGALFMSTLHSAAGGPVLGNGWSGLLGAALIGGSMLAGFWAYSRRNDAATDQEEPPVVPTDGIAALGLLAGLAFINLAPLFVLPWRFAAMVWPITSIATLLWALRARHHGAIGFAVVLQAIAGFAHVGDRVFSFGTASVSADAKPFLHSGFLGPLLISCAALVCAWLLQRRQPQDAERRLGWIALLWGGAWWAFSWTDELIRVLEPDSARASLTGMAVVTVWLWSITARRLNWPQLGQATLAYVPVLTMIAASGWLASLSFSHPMSGWGALAWPLAFVTHLLLLRRQTAWVEVSLHGLAHILGAWLFVVQAAVELQWQFAQWTNVDTAWPLLGWMVAPVLYLWLLTLRRLRARWPIAEQLEAYTVISAAPMVLYLIGWVWVANFASDGSAAPLPFVPLLNPLELAQLAVLTCVVVWWWSLRQHPWFTGRLPLVAATIGASALAVATGTVARTCHHWAGVPWRLHALLDSALFQTSLSIVWSAVSIGVMILGNRKRLRWVWITGATLMAVVVAKLFLVELAARGSLTRIVSFIVVGLLLLLVGYFAPLPPKRNEVSDSANPVSA